MTAPSTIGLICPYSFSGPGGVQNHVLGLAGWLSGQGHRVQVLGPGRPTAAMLQAAGLRPEQYTSTGTAVPLRYNGSVARLSFGPLAAARVRAWLRRVQPDIVHLHEPITPSIALFALWQARCPVVATFHTATSADSRLSAARRHLRRTIGRVDAGIAVSPAAHEVARRHLGLDPVIIGNGISLGARPDDLDRTWWRGSPGPRITFVGRYDEPRKGFEVLTQALPLIRHRVPHLEVCVVGEGTPRALPSIRFLGYVDDRERDEVLGASDVYVAPHTGRESFGIVLLEALAAGADVVASDLPAFRDVLIDDHQDLVGTLATTGDPYSLAEQVIRVLENPSPARRAAGWEHAMTYDWSVIGQEVAGVYASVGWGRGPQRPTRQR
ncbi:glycosyltransferase family 4 protein [Propionibacteriaceae bacterium Y1923]